MALFRKPRRYQRGSNAPKLTGGPDGHAPLRNNRGHLTDPQAARPFVSRNTARVGNLGRKRGLWALPLEVIVNSTEDNNARTFDRQRSAPGSLLEDVALVFHCCPFNHRQ